MKKLLWLQLLCLKSASASDGSTQRSDGTSNTVRPRGSISQQSWWSLYGAMSSLGNLIRGGASSRWNWFLDYLTTLDQVNLEFPLHHPIIGAEVRAGAQLSLRVSDTDGFSSSYWSMLGGAGSSAKPSFPIRFYAVPAECRTSSDSRQVNPVKIAQCIRQRFTDNPAATISPIEEYGDSSEVHVQIPVAPHTMPLHMDGTRGLAQLLDEILNHDGLCLESDRSILTAAIAHGANVPLTADLIVSAKDISISTTPHGDPCGRLFETVPRTAILTSTNHQGWLWRQSWGRNARMKPISRLGPQALQILNDESTDFEQDGGENVEVWNARPFHPAETVAFTVTLKLSKTKPSSGRITNDSGFGALFSVGSIRTIVWLDVLKGTLQVKLHRERQNGADLMAEKRSGAGFPADLITAGVDLHVLFIWRPGAQRIEVLVRQEALGTVPGARPRTWSTIFELGSSLFQFEPKEQMMIGFKAASTTTAPFSLKISGWQVNQVLPDLYKTRIWFIGIVSPLPNQTCMILARLHDEHGLPLYMPPLPVSFRLRRITTLPGSQKHHRLRIGKSSVKTRVRPRPDLGLLKIYFKAKMPGRYLILARIGGLTPQPLEDPKRWRIIPNHHIYVRHYW